MQVSSVEFQNQFGTLADKALTEPERSRNLVGEHFGRGGYFVSTIGRDEELIREYIRNKEREDRRLDQLNLWR
jgi:putative transposase